MSKDYVLSTANKITASFLQAHLKAHDEPFSEDAWLGAIGAIHFLRQFNLIREDAIEWDLESHEAVPAFQRRGDWVPGEETGLGRPGESAPASLDS